MSNTVFKSTEAKNDQEKIVKYLKSKGIYYISRGSRFIYFEAINGDESSFDREWIHSTPKEIAEEIHIDLKIKINQSDLIDIAIENGFAKKKHIIAKSDSYNMNALNMAKIEEQYWIHNRQFYEDITANKNKYIDLLIYSLAGEDSDSKKHIEEWISFKLFNATDSATLPALNIFGQGGTGKNLFYEYLIPTMFHGAGTVTSANMKHVSGFNGHFEGKRFAVFNESSSDKADTDGIKGIIGSKKLSIEKKGIDRYEADNLMSVLMFTNDPLGSIKLDKQDGVNRRYSIIKCTKTLKSIIKELHPEDDVEDFICDLMDALEDEKQVAEWVAWLEQNRLNNRPPKAHHGIAYQELKEDTKNVAEQFFDYVFYSLKLKAIPMVVAHDCIKHLHKAATGKSLHNTAMKGMVKDCLNIEEVEQGKNTRINGKQMKCYKFSGGMADYNEGLFLDYNGDVKKNLHRDLEQMTAPDIVNNNVLSFVDVKRVV